MLKEIDFEHVNLAEDDLNAILVAYEMVRGVVSDLQKNHKMRFTRTPVNDILQTDYLREYKIPLCFREIDDDLSVEPSNENVLDAVV